MKKLTVALAATLLFAANTHATQWAISNTAPSPGQFTTIAAALASPLVLTGDTFLVQPSIISYGSFTLNKGIVFIGGGYNTQKPSNVYSTLGTVTINAASPTLANGSKFYGFRIASFIGNGTGNINNIGFEECYFDGISAISFINTALPVSMVIRNCTFFSTGTNIEFGQLSGAVASSVYIYNSLFGGQINNNRATLQLKNCTFLTAGFNNIQFAQFENCIFRSGNLLGISNSQYNNCIHATIALPNTGNTGSNNLAPAAVTFVNVPVNQVLLSYNYNLTPASPGYTGGNDGQQLGIYGGNSTFSLYGEPLNSSITRSFIITNPVVPVNGTLNFNATVTKPNTQ